jgi:hypothetical protein
MLWMDSVRSVAYQATKTTTRQAAKNALDSA